MKQGISPAVAAVIIIVVVLIIGAIGYFTVFKSPGGGDAAIEEPIDHTAVDAMEAQNMEQQQGDDMGMPPAQGPQ